MNLAVPSLLISVGRNDRYFLICLPHTCLLSLCAQTLQSLGCHTTARCTPGLPWVPSRFSIGDSKFDSFGTLGHLLRTDNQPPLRNNEKHRGQLLQSGLRHRKHKRHCRVGVRKEAFLPSEKVPSGLHRCLCGMNILHSPTVTQEHITPHQCWYAVADDILQGWCHVLCGLLSPAMGVPYSTALDSVSVEWQPVTQWPSYFLSFCVLKQKFSEKHDFSRPQIWSLAPTLGLL